MQAAWRLTLVSAGRLRVEEIADRVGWSSRHLLARFRARTGLTPKEVARVARFDAPADRSPHALRVDGPRTSPGWRRRRGSPTRRT